jgi:hypothetical protein
MYLNWELLLFPCILPHNNNGNSVPMRPDSFLTMGTAFPHVPPRNDHWLGGTQNVKNGPVGHERDIFRTVETENFSTDDHHTVQLLCT